MSPLESNATGCCDVDEGTGMKLGSMYSPRMRLVRIWGIKYQCILKNPKVLTPAIVSVAKIYSHLELSLGISYRVRLPHD